jgi:lipopolysaccharide transport system ATP-binding protein
MSALAITLEGVSKRYFLGPRGGLRHLARELARRSTRQELWAVRDVDLELEQGRSLALVGANGAGKSTLLKLMSRVTRPTGGRIKVSGRVSSLIEIGAGFHPELTGRENVFLNGAILGMPRREIARRLDEIVAFAELEQFVDTPVKRYSSGMHARLGFSVAVHTDPDILLVDEVLAVGDARFRQRSYEKVKELVSEERTVVVVSHQMPMVRRLCDRGIMLEHGRVVFEGTADGAASYYEAHVTAPTLRWESIGDAHSEIDILEVSRTDGARALRTGDSIRIRARVHRHVSDGAATVAVFLNRPDGMTVAMGRCPDELPAGKPVEIEASMPLLAAPGPYFLHVAVMDPNTPEVAFEDVCVAVDVSGDDPYLSAALTTVPVEWVWR